MGDDAVRIAFDSFADSHQPHLRKLRELILDEAARLDLPGGVEETLKWGEPSYLPGKARVGTAIRLGSFDKEHVALYVNCQTTLVERYRALFGDRLSYSKNRAVRFGISEPLPQEAVRVCARMALHYHLDKKG